MRYKLLSLLCFTVLNPQHALAGLMSDKFALQEFRDFAENLGRYTPGMTGIQVPEKDGVTSHTLNFPMPDFGSVASGGYATLYSPSYLTGVKHNGGYKSVDFGNDAKYKTSYKLINRNEDSSKDYHLPRLNKVVTEAAPLATVADGADLKMYPERYVNYTRVGTGTQIQLDPETGAEIKLAGAYKWKTGGTFSDIVFENHRLRWYMHGPDDPDVAPLEIGGKGGDSGSPVLVFDEVEKVWKIAGVATAIGSSGYNQRTYALYVQNPFSLAVIAANTSPDVNDIAGEGTIHWTQDAITQGSSAWGWSGLDEKYQHLTPAQASNEELDATQDLRFKGAGGNLNLDDAINMGAGKLRFSADYVVQPGLNQDATWAGGGIEVDEGRTVRWGVNGVANDALHKIGKGTLWINAAGVNPGSLNSGDGTVILDQQPDATGNKQAFSSMTLVSGRPTVVLGDTGQINPDAIFFGYRGGTLDLNGNSLRFRQINHSDSGATLVNRNPSAAATITLTGMTEKRNRLVFRGFLGERDPAHAQGELNLNIAMPDNDAVVALTGGANLSGNMEVKTGTLLLSGQPVPHAGGVVYDDDWQTAAYNAGAIGVQPGATLQVGTWARVKADLHAADGAQIMLGYRDALDGGTPLWRCFGENTCSQAELSRAVADTMPESIVEGDITLGSGAHLQLGKLAWQGSLSGQTQSSMDMARRSLWQITGSSSVSSLIAAPGSHISYLATQGKPWQAKTLDVDTLDATGLSVSLGLDPAAGTGDKLVIRQQATGKDNSLKLMVQGGTVDLSPPKRDVVFAEAPGGTDHSFFTLASLARGFTLYTPDFQVQDVDGRVQWLIQGKKEDNVVINTPPPVDTHPTSPDNGNSADSTPQDTSPPDNAEIAPEESDTSSSADTDETVQQDNATIIPPENGQESWLLASDNVRLIQDTTSLLGTRRYLLNRATGENRARQLRSAQDQSGTWATMTQTRGGYGRMDITRNVLSMGVDNLIDNQLYGLSASITWGNATGAGREKHNLYAAGAYYGWEKQGLSVDLSARYMHLVQDFSTDPSLEIEQQKKSSDILAASLRAGYLLPVRPWGVNLTPSVEMSGMAVSGYTMTGNEARISLSSGTPWFFTSGLSAMKTLTEVPVTVTADLGWQYASGQGASTLSLTDSHGSRTYREHADRSMLASLGVQGNLTERWSASASMNYRSGGIYHDEAGGSIGVNYRF